MIRRAVQLLVVVSRGAGFFLGSGRGEALVPPDRPSKLRMVFDRNAILCVFYPFWGTLAQLTESSNAQAGP